MDADATAVSESRSLELFYSASDREARELLNRLAEHEITPLIKKIVTRRLATLTAAGRFGPEDLDDVIRDAVLRMTQYLYEGRNGGPRVSSVAGYTARVAEHACDEFFRRTFRLRYNAMKRVLVNLRESPLFYEWRLSDGVKAGALSIWPSPPPIADPERVLAIRQNPKDCAQPILRQYPQPSKASDNSTAHTLQATLGWVGGALPVDDLVLVVQSARQEFDVPMLELKADLVAAKTDTIQGAESDFLRSVWREISRLRPRQAKALLLNLRIMGESGVDLFWTEGIASQAEVAKILELDDEEFTSNVLPELPWPDRKIAVHLDCTEEQVSALRSTARRTLASRIVSAGDFSEECFRFRL